LQTLKISLHKTSPGVVFHCLSQCFVSAQPTANRLWPDMALAV
jgi:hypothetical protein